MREAGAFDDRHSILLADAGHDDEPQRLPNRDQPAHYMVRAIEGLPLGTRYPEQEARVRAVVDS